MPCSREAFRVWQLRLKRAPHALRLFNQIYFKVFFDVYYLRIENAEGYVLIAIYLFIYLFVCMLLA